MDYDDKDYDEGYSIRDIENDWLNGNMDYETDSDSDSDMDDYNYNYNNSTNNWSTLTGDKTNRQTDRRNNSFLDTINKKLEYLENIERCIAVERKNDRFLDLLEKLKALNLEREFEPHHRSPLTKIMIDNWHNKRNSVIEKWHINSSRKDDRELKAIERPMAITYKDNKIDIGKDDLKKEGLKTILTKKKQNCSIEIMQYKKYNKKDFDERKDYSHVVQKMIEVEKEVKKEKSSIEIIQKKKTDIIDEDKEKGIERQQGNSILTNSKETLCKEIEIGKERNMMK